MEYQLPSKIYLTADHAVLFQLLVKRPINYRQDKFENPVLDKFQITKDNFRTIFKNVLLTVYKYHNAMQRPNLNINPQNIIINESNLTAYLADVDFSCVLCHAAGFETPMNKHLRVWHTPKLNSNSSPTISWDYYSLFRLFSYMFLRAGEPEPRLQNISNIEELYARRELRDVKERQLKLNLLYHSCIYAPLSVLTFIFEKQHSGLLKQNSRCDALHVAPGYCMYCRTKKISVVFKFICGHAYLCDACCPRLGEVEHCIVCSSTRFPLPRPFRGLEYIDLGRL
jgi:hypothetical protein